MKEPKSGHKERILISVVMPAYNRANFVGRAIDSVLTQEVDADIELLIGDNASTEDTKSVYEEYMQKYPGKITVFYRKENLGIGPNWASLVLSAKGKYVCNCDNDDFWHNPHKLQVQLDYMESRPQANVLFTNFRTLYSKTGKIEESDLHPAIQSKEAFQKDIWHGFSKNTYHISTIMFRRDFVLKNVPLRGFIDRRLPLQDWPFYLLLSEHTFFDFIPDSTATFCIHGESYTHKRTYEDLSKRLDRDAENLKFIYEHIPHLGTFDPVDWGYYTNDRLLSLAYTNNDYRSAHQYAKQTKYRSIKKKMACTWLTFKLYVWASKLKRKSNGYT